MPWIKRSNSARIRSGSRGQDFGSPIRSLKRATIRRNRSASGPAATRSPWLRSCRSTTSHLPKSCVAKKSMMLP